MVDTGRRSQVTLDESGPPDSMETPKRSHRSRKRVKASVHGRSVSVERMEDGSMLVEVESRNHSERYFHRFLEEQIEEAPEYDVYVRKWNRQHVRLPQITSTSIRPPAKTYENSNSFAPYITSTPLRPPLNIDDGSTSTATAPPLADEKFPKLKLRRSKGMRTPIQKIDVGALGTVLSHYSLSNRQGKLNEELTKTDTEEKDVNSGGPLWHVGTSRSPREKNKLRSKNVPKSFFWSDLLNELNDKSAPGTTSSDAHKKSPRADKIASISAEVLLDGYSVSECPFGHRRLVGSHLISKEAINCRHCRYLVALHEQRSRPPQRRQNDTSRSNKMTSSMVLPEIREHKSPECADSGSATQSPAKNAAQQQAPEQSQAANSAATKAKPNRRRLGNYHKEVQQPSIPSVHHTVSHIPHLYVSGTTTEIARQEEKPLATTSTQAKTAKNQLRTVEPAQPNKINNGNSAGNVNGSNSSSGTTMTSCKADRIIIVDDTDVETRIAKKEPPFYSIFANPFDAGLPAIIRERLVEMQRLEGVTVRREREEEARRRMKRARKHRAATTTDDAEDDDV